MALFYSGVTASQHARHQDPETESAPWNPAIVGFTIHRLGFSDRNVTEVFFADFFILRIYLEV